LLRALEQERAPVGVYCVGYRFEDAFVGAILGGYKRVVAHVKCSKKSLTKSDLILR
jgi:hypothetical protein